MNLPRRDFFKTTLAASAAAALANRGPAAESGGGAGREYYELRCYRLKAEGRLSADAPRAGVEAYLEQALLPALERRGISNTGVFTELEVKKTEGTSASRADSPVWVLIPHASLESFVAVSADINRDPAVREAGAVYLQAAKAAPAFERIDTWLLRAFRGLPQMERPAYAQERRAGRVFELRTYESFSEEKALAKMAMFDDGEIELMKAIGMGPVFFGQALAGRDLPHLAYMISAPDLATHLANWRTFAKHPDWIKMRDDPRYADTVSKNIPRFLAPTAYSRI